MYEEEDDDLPMQYRRLTAHLQTGSADFNRRLSAYLTNHVAMRTALDQAITDSYAQQYPNAPQFVHNQTIYPSPFMAHNMPHQQQQSPISYSQPYPSPGTPGYRPGHQARSASNSHVAPTYSPNVSLPSPNQQFSNVAHRKASGSSKSASQSPPGATPATPATPQSMQARPTLSQAPSSNNVKEESQPSQQMRAPPHPSPRQQHQSVSPPKGLSNTSPFSTSLPPETQMLLGSALDPNDPMTSMFMAGSENLPQPYNYNFSPPMPQKTRSFQQSFDGMSATLAPSALDMSPRQQSYNQPLKNMPAGSALTPSFQLGFDGSMSEFAKGQMFTSANSSTGSGTATPGAIDGGWDAFINDTSWAENAT